MWTSSGSVLVGAPSVGETMSHHQTPETSQMFLSSQLALKGTLWGMCRPDSNPMSGTWPEFFVPMADSCFWLGHHLLLSKPSPVSIRLPGTLWALRTLKGLHLTPALSRAQVSKGNILKELYSLPVWGGACLRKAGNFIHTFISHSQCWQQIQERTSSYCWWELSVDSNFQRPSWNHVHEKT